MTDLIQIEEINALELFTHEGVQELVNNIKAKISEFKPDMSTEAGKEEIKALAHRVGKAKNAVEKLRKELTDDWHKKKKAVDEVGKIAWDSLEALQKQVREPLTKWEEAQEMRLATLKDRMQKLQDCGKIMHGVNSSLISNMLVRANDLFKFDWEEFTDMAQTEFDAVKKLLDEKLAEVLKHEAEQAELAILRAQAAERAKKEHEDKIAAEAAEKARIDAEAKAAQTIAQLQKEKEDLQKVQVMPEAKPADPIVSQNPPQVREGLFTIVCEWAETHKLAVNLEQIEDLRARLQQSNFRIAA